MHFDACFRHVIIFQESTAATGCHHGCAFSEADWELCTGHTAFLQLVHAFPDFVPASLHAGAHERYLVITFRDH